MNRTRMRPVVLRCERMASWGTFGGSRVATEALRGVARRPGSAGGRDGGAGFEDEGCSVAVRDDGSASAEAAFAAHVATAAGRGFRPYTRGHSRAALREPEVERVTCWPPADWGQGARRVLRRLPQAVQRQELRSTGGRHAPRHGYARVGARVARIEGARDGPSGLPRSRRKWRAGRSTHAPRSSVRRPA